MSQPNTLQQWIKQRRRALNLTQKEAAAQLHLPKDTYRRYEDGSRRTPIPIAQEMLRVFDIPLRAQAQFLALAAGLSDATPVVSANGTAKVAAQSAPFQQVPSPPTPLFGRAADLEALQHRFLHAGARFITLTGPPGVGKTRLASTAAGHIAAHLADGACFVDLTPVTSADGVLAATARALNVREAAGQTSADALMAALRQREMLVVLDNFEHVLLAARVIAELVAHCPRVRVLVTSRERLRVRPEQQVKVEPLAIEPAVAFFVDRALAANSHFHIDETSTPLIQRICARLDGLPLALELVAANCDDMDAHALCQAVESNFDLPAGLRDLPARQQTVMSAIAWSYALMTPALQRAFNTLGVFAGGFDAEAAQAMGVSARQIDQLCAKSLVQVQGAAPARYRLLETLREFTLARLTEAAALEDAQARHADYFAGVVRAASNTSAGGSDGTTLRRWVANLDNLRAALDWLLRRGTHDAAVQALVMASDSHQVWRQSGLFEEGLQWLERALTGCDAARVDSAILAEAYRRAGFMASQLGQARCSELLRQAEMLFERANDGAGRGRVLMLMGMLSRYPGNRRRTERFLDESMALLREFGSPADLLPLLTQYILLHQQCTGDGAMALRYIQQQQAMARQLNALNYDIGAQSALGMAQLLIGDLDAAEAHFNVVLRAEDVAKGELVETHLGQGLVAERRGKWAEARRHFNESLALVRAQGLSHGHTVLTASLGRVAAREGKLAEAQTLFTESLRTSLSTFDVEPATHCLVGLAFVAMHDPKECPSAARLLGVSHAVRSVFHIKPNPCDTYLAEAARDRASAALGTVAFESLARHAEEALRARIPTVEFDTGWEAVEKIKLTETIAAALHPTALS